MNFNLYKFDNKETISKKSILKILQDNKIDCQIIDIKFNNFKKVLIKIKEYDEIYLLKLCFDTYSINLCKNESNGYLYFASENKLNFKLPNYKLININEDYGLSRVELIKGKKGNYFDFYKFYPKNFKYELKKVQLENYVSSIKDKFKLENKDSINQIMDGYLKKFNNFEIPINVSHGDFIHWNTIKNSGVNYIFDLEFFENNRSFLYDYFHWYLTPIINKMIQFDINFPLIKSPNFLIIKILKKGITENFYKEIFKNKFLFQILLVLFIFERYLTLNYEINLKNINELIDEKQKVHTSKHINILLNILKKFVKD